MNAPPAVLPAAAAALTPAAAPLHALALLRYGAPSLAFAFVALPLYVYLPEHYATRYAVPLGYLGGVLLLTRFADALFDPWLGRLADHLLRRGWAKPALLAACALMFAGFAALFALPALLPFAAGEWRFTLLFIAALLLTYLGFSAASIVHQAWGATLGADEAQLARTVAWREGLGLAGVLLAAVVPQLGGATALVAVFAVALILSLALLRRAPDPAPHHAVAHAKLHWRSLLAPLHSRRFVALLAVFVTSGIAAAIPATLVLFFIRDRLDAAALSGAYLFAYFAAAGLLVPIWLRAVRRWGAARCWLLGMGLAVAAFVWAALLQPGDRWGYALVVVLSGAALGPDLVMPPALLAGVIRAGGHGNRLEGSYFGVWNFATKLNLALAAGLALPLLALFGYRPGTLETGVLPPLVVAYCLLPSLLKLVSAGLLWQFFVRGRSGPAAFAS
ncbi:MAG: MFS transporter [Betaproteobacteria bacterium]|jgi:Na+/melibiose symporter-like transporter|uniref:MFS transporter n=1 Tax=Thiomonas TaxID=32012 RepID=UPI000BCE5261|nr:MULTISPECIES: MFS transporter [Thiomonas]MDE2174480.1 MFS transporter [Betaproteobacteria bacterium]OZB72106.1 MAG: MFS transporter [Thiomonas sp. 13-64-67]HML81261.1 MFS transporter [Thiomonas arsenitoxydans]